MKIYWKKKLFLVTVRCSLSGRTRKLCSHIEYIIRPIPNDGSITDGTYSSTRIKKIIKLIELI
jgi:hypothetical protein